MQRISRLVCISVASLSLIAPECALAQFRDQKELESRAMTEVLDAHSKRHGVGSQPRSSPLMLLITYFGPSTIGAFGVEEYEDESAASFRYFYGWARQGGGPLPKRSRAELLKLITKLPDGKFEGLDVDKVIISYYGGRQPWTRVYDRKRLPEAVLTLLDHYNLVIVPQVPQIQAALEWERETVTALAWSDDLLSSDIDGSISRWDSTTGRLIETVARARDDQVVFMASDSLGRRLAYFTGHFNTIDVIDTTTRDGAIKRLGGFEIEHQPTVMAFLEKSDLLFVALKKESGIWNWTSRKRVKALPASSAVVLTDRTGGFAIAVRDGVHLYRSPDDVGQGGPTVVKTEDVTFPQLVAAPRAGVIGYQVAPKKMRFFNRSTPDDHITIRPYPWPASCVAISPDGKYFAVRAPRVGGTPFLYDVRSGKPIAQLASDRSPIDGAEYECVVFSPDGKNVAANAAGHIRIWRIADADRN